MRIPPRRFKHFLPLLALSCHGCQEPPDAISNEGSEGSAFNPSAASPALRDTIVNRVWVSTDATDPPGQMRIFLSDGTLVSNSCWETFRLSSWQMGLGGTIIWREDEAEIKAEIVESTDTALVLRLILVDGEKLEHYQAASVPYVCPDIPR